MTQILRELFSRWKSAGVDVLPSERASAVAEAFYAVGQRATADVVALYGAIGGMKEMDGEYWRLWSLAEIRGQAKSDRGVVFSDYLVSCWDYRLKPVSESVSAVYVDRYDHSAPLLVAHSLQSFLEQYATNARLLLDSKSIKSA
jgi:hypothetical protein